MKGYYLWAPLEAGCIGNGSGVEKKITFTQMDFFKPDEPLLPAGLIGPVEILGFEN